MEKAIMDLDQLIHIYVSLAWQALVEFQANLVYLSAYEILQIACQVLYLSLETIKPVRKIID